MASACTNAKRLRLAKNGDTGFKIEHAGKRGGEATNAKKRGIRGAFKQEAAEILLGCGPTKCCKLFHKRYADVPELISLLPDHVQLKNHKTHQKSKLAGLILRSFSSGLLLGCAQRALVFCRHLNWGDFNSARDAEDFYSLRQDFQHLLIVLECFQHDITSDEGKMPSCFDLVLLLGGWTLVDFGTYMTHYTRNQYSKTFGSWAYKFVRIEHQTAYKTMFASVRKYAGLFFGISLNRLRLY
ncbi:hypothetical protein PHMEG_00031861, partial [Phytophthora megakarya]